ncbi:MAG TPA: CoA ester lyase [Vicinamibacterales bacterium]|nr:CoA ester lyase [Vicinamibacterales bacterium]
MRSMLFVPGTRPDRFASALASGADAIIFDLEDSVDPTKKGQARDAVAAFLSRPPSTAASLFVRVNGFESAWFSEDMDSVGGLGAIGGVVLPKAEVPAHVGAAAQASASGRVIPLIETARGVLNAAAIAAAAASIPAMLFGAEDLTAQIGIPRTIDGDELVFARSQVVLAATSVGADAIDAVLINITALDDLRRDALRARALGFRGKMAIHPSQIPVIHEVFSPSSAERAHAQRIVDAFDRAQANGQGVIRLDDRMVDMPVVLRAKRLLALG